ncbi:hypothetical protein B0A71_20675 [Flavobacterium tructae]|uniref:Uncharacterized protein n=1 Tax=Flavobacterium tructae TaxID=1114873 RepID=A0A1S1J8Z5_9FLAO|nr:hypothetical protein BHE19_21465 [Flavobacterium tructae]OXB15334.1 hypothetical protein B0A71_20675 [Flavobacterium tructae]
MSLTQIFQIELFIKHIYSFKYDYIISRFENENSRGKNYIYTNFLKFFFKDWVITIWKFNFWICN